VPQIFRVKPIWFLAKKKKKKTGEKKKENTHNNSWPEILQKHCGNKKTN